MIEAISSLIFGTFDLFLKLSSKDIRRQKHGRSFYETYEALGEVARSMESIERTAKAFSTSRGTTSLPNLPDYIRVRSTSSDGTAEIQVRSLSQDVQSIVSDTRRVNIVDLLPIALAKDISDFRRAVNKLGRLMDLQTMGLAKSSRLDKIEVYDQALVRQLRRAWSYDSGFIFELNRLGITTEGDRNTILLTDVNYASRAVISTDPIDGFEVYPHRVRLSLLNTEDIEKLTHLLNRAHKIVLDAQKMVRAFIIEHFSVEDLL